MWNSIFLVEIVRLHTWGSQSAVPISMSQWWQMLELLPNSWRNISKMTKANHMLITKFKMAKATRRAYPFERVTSVENLQKEPSYYYYYTDLKSSRRKIRLHTIGGNMILKNISGSKIAFKSISFSFLSSTWPRNVYAYVSFGTLFGTCGFNLPGNYIQR